MTETTIAARDIVAEAVAALECFGDDLTREDADRLLSMWRDRRLLSVEQRRAVLDTIEPEREQLAQVDYLPELRGVLDGPAVAYADDDPHAPKGGA